ncbi:leucine-rich repeat domain-containing protein [Arcticibacterium luteifluviistationis]|uniref:Ig-like domain-containing protein n=1 Tax=Arcticibacterium luteifluviistationis TaxID=1784714 RepID=A0A2Z4G8R3_9BACT|nr:3-coathanger stack domain-containing protein [Arcticibacterium luteifluviistationis]AWV97544.1 hypothetical protein DJ013_04935 [Arcticibacterium luteifluviistationis]
MKKIFTILTFYFIIHCSYGQCNTSDFQSLKDFYNVTLTDYWSTNASWAVIRDNSLPPANCTFQGIYGITSEVIAGEERVTGISFQNSYIPGVLSSSIGSLSELKTLTITGTMRDNPATALSGTIPVEMLNLTKLTKADLTNNALTGLVPDFGSLPLMANLSIIANSFQFGDLEPNFSSNQSISTFEYEYQSFDAQYWFQRAQVGDDVSVNTGISGANNQYQWKKNGSWLTGEANSSVLVPNIQESQFGNDKYQAIVTSSTIPGLSLTSPEIVILEDGVNCHPTDFAALKDLYNSAGGSSWYPQFMWNDIRENDTPPANCTFFGINLLESEKIDGAERITSFSNTSYQYGGFLPASIADMEHLEVFEIRNGNPPFWSPKITAIPAEIGSLTNLKKLVLSDLEIEGTIPSLAGLTSLEELDLGSNKLEGGIPAYLGNLTNLEKINLGSNKLSGSIPSNLLNLNDLQEFSVYGNDISGVVPDFSSLTQLSYLSIGENKFQFGDFETKLDDFNVAFSFNYNPQKKVGPDSYLRTNIGGSLTFEAVVSGDENTYQWYFDGSPLMGETNATLVLNNIQPSQIAKSYFCEINSDIVTDLTLQTGVFVPLKNGVNCSATDFAALKAFYEAAEGDNWRYNTGWEIITENATPPANCTFTGIFGTTKSEVNNEERIVALELQGNNLKGMLSPSLGDLSELTTLHMDGSYSGPGSSSNYISGSIPSTLGDLEKLTSVKLANQGLSGCFDYNLKKLCGQLTTAQFYNYLLDASWEDFCSSNAGVCPGTLPPCAESAVLVSMVDDVSSGQTNIDVKNSTGFIEASNKITGTAKATFSAGRYIYLKPGFIANSGTVFLAQNGGCD